MPNYNAKFDLERAKASHQLEVVVVRNTKDLVRILVRVDAPGSARSERKVANDQLPNAVD